MVAIALCCMLALRAQLTHEIIAFSSVAHQRRLVGVQIALQGIALISHRGSLCTTFRQVGLQSVTHYLRTVTLLLGLIKLRTQLRQLNALCALVGREHSLARCQLSEVLRQAFQVLLLSGKFLFTLRKPLRHRPKHGIIALRCRLVQLQLLVLGTRVLQIVLEARHCERGRR